MDKETLSNYGWIVICILVLAVMLALATPFGRFISDAVWNTANSFFDLNSSALDNVLGDYDLSSDEVSTSVLAQGNSWITKNCDNALIKSITEIHIKDDYTPSLAFISSWDVSANEDGSVIAYVDGTKLYIVNKTKGKIQLNPNSANLFSGMTSLKAIYGLNMLDASKVETMANAFENNFALTNIDLSELRFKENIDTSFMFSQCISLKKATLSTTITTVGERMFRKCIALETISGLSNITSINAFAFANTPQLTKTDLMPEKLIHIGESACFMSSIEDGTDLSVVPLSYVEDKATRHKRWSSETLTALQNLSGHNSVYINVPNVDCQKTYTDVLFAITNGVEEMAPESACSSFTLYHIWNALYAGTSKEYSNWLDWFNDNINADGTFVKNNNMTRVFEKQVEILRWSGGDRVFVKNQEQMHILINRLEQGLPTYISRSSSNNQGGMHGVVAIGYNAETHKFAVVDSSACDIAGVVYWIAFEDMFVEGYGSGNYDSIRPLDYGSIN